MLGIEGGGGSGEGEGPGDRGDGFRISYRERTVADCTFEKITKIMGSGVPRLNCHT